MNRTDNMKPTVGQIVHFYNKDWENQTLGSNNKILNEQGAGPYPAIVIQVFDPNSPYVNLRVTCWGGEWSEGSVSEYSETNDKRYWTWPPRE